MNCGMIVHSSDIPHRTSFGQHSLLNEETWLHPGDSAVVHPDGECIVGPLHRQEALLYADIDLRQCCEPKWMLNVAGYDARPDIFQLTVHQESREVMHLQQTLPESSEHLL